MNQYNPVCGDDGSGGNNYIGVAAPLPSKGIKGG